MNDRKDLKLLTARGFINAHFEMLPNYTTGMDAYDALEERYNRLFGKYKYSNYESFRVVKHRILKADRNKKKQHKM